MWLFSQHGFVSVVENHSDPTKVLVRARVRSDIEYMAAQYASADSSINGNTKPVKVTETPSRDYMYRFVADKQLLGIVVANEVLKINYGNFKEQCHDTLPRRDRELGQIWGAALRWQQGGSWAGRPPRFDDGDTVGVPFVVFEAEHDEEDDDDFDSMMEDVDFKPEI